MAGVAGTGRISVNRRAAALVERLAAETAALGVEVHRLANGTRVVDAGVRAPGG
ncbi:MAG: methenyltetrahydromethanopterin cyclohydrolase, partial [Candidatus Methylomirabilales bacterium]